MWSSSVPVFEPMQVSLIRRVLLSNSVLVTLRTQFEANVRTGAFAADVANFSILLDSSAPSQDPYFALTTAIHRVLRERFSNQKLNGTIGTVTPQNSQPSPKPSPQDRKSYLWDWCGVSIVLYRSPMKAWERG